MNVNNMLGNLEGEKMRKFETPVMSIQKLVSEEIVRTSSCFEAHDCLSCYCVAVTCDGTYECIGLNCPSLED